MGVYGPVPALISLFVGCVACIIGGLLVHYMPTILTNLVAQKLVLGPDSLLFDTWKNTPIPIYLQFYVFNYTNHEDFLENWKSGVKPTVQQLGPYTYRQLQRRENITWTENDTVEYRNIKTFHFVPEMSSGREDDLIILPNIPLATIAQMAPEREKISLRIAIQMTNTSIFVEQTVGNVLFYGYKDSLLELIFLLTGEELLPNSTFGLFYGKNNSDENVFKVSRGTDNIKNLGSIVEYNNASQLSFWTGDYCNKLNGTDATIFAPNISKSDKLFVFSPDLCRSLYLRFNKEINYKGVNGYRFTTTLELLGDMNMNPDNECFCYPNSSVCNSAGVINLSNCKGGAPIYMSSPHFLRADFNYMRAIDGMEPHVEEHNTVVELEPISGSILTAARRVQMNMQMKPVANFPDIDQLPEILLPLVWLNESAKLTDELLDKLHSHLFVPMKAGYIIPLVIIGLGGIIALLGLTCTIGLMFKNNSSVMHIVNGEKYSKTSKS